MPNITTNHAITYTNNKGLIFQYSYNNYNSTLILQSDIYTDIYTALN